MNTKLKKLNPYLYPFKMKTQDILNPQIFQAPATLFLNKTMNPFHQINVKKYQFMVPSNSNTIPLTILKTETRIDPAQTRIETSTKSKVTFDTLGSITPQYCVGPHPKTFEKPKSYQSSNSTQNMTSLNGPHLTHLSNETCERLNPMNMVFESSNSNIFGRATPEDVSWTRLDRSQQKLDLVIMIPTKVKVIMGIISGMIATAAVHPVDVIKVRLQLFPKKVTTMRMLHRIMVCEGTRGLYAGLTAGMLRQLTYTGSRLFVYNSLWTKYKNEYDQLPDFPARLKIAIVAGLVGAFMGTPSEIGLVRMIEVGRLRRSRCSPRCAMACKYVQQPENVLKQLLRIAHREGIATWWRGAVPTLIRSIFVTTAQVGVYSEVREVFTGGEHMDSSIKLHLYTALISSFFSTFLSLPVDQVKTRYQSFQERHSRSVDILKDILKKKGVRYLWKGFLPYYVRQITHTVISYVILDLLVDRYLSLQETAQPKK